MFHQTEKETYGGVMVVNFAHLKCPSSAANQHVKRCDFHVVETVREVEDGVKYKASIVPYFEG